nr:MAG TPA: hypothetical protein [Bacteriophage sp.]
MRSSHGRISLFRLIGFFVWTVHVAPHVRGYRPIDLSSFVWYG